MSCRLWEMIDAHENCCVAQRIQSLHIHAITEIPATGDFLSNYTE